MTLTPPRPNERDQPALTRADAETDAGQELETEIDDGSRRAERIGLYAGPLLAAAAVVLTHPACGGYGGFSANASPRRSSRWREPRRFVYSLHS